MHHDGTSYEDDILGPIMDLHFEKHIRTRSDLITWWDGVITRWGVPGGGMVFAARTLNNTRYSGFFTESTAMDCDRAQLKKIYELLWGRLREKHQIPGERLVGQQSYDEHRVELEDEHGDFDAGAQQSGGSLPPKGSRPKNYMDSLEIANWLVEDCKIGYQDHPFRNEVRQSAPPSS
jgi:hypothetical protein